MNAFRAVAGLALAVIAVPAVAAPWTTHQGEVGDDYAYLASQVDTTGAYRLTAQCFAVSMQFMLFFDSNRKGSPTGAEKPAKFTIDGASYDLMFVEVDGGGREKLGAVSLNQEVDFAEVWVALLSATGTFELDIAGLYLDFDSAGIAEAMAHLDEMCRGNDY